MAVSVLFNKLYFTYWLALYLVLHLQGFMQTLSLKNLYFGLWSDKFIAATNFEASNAYISNRETY